MYYSYVEIEYVATSFSPARTDLALKLLKQNKELLLTYSPKFCEIVGNIERKHFFGKHSKTAKELDFALKTAARM
jgi:hypothetical protein